MALSRLQGVAMLFGFIYNAKPDSKTNRILPMLKVRYAWSSIRLFSIPEFASAIRIPAYREKV